MTKNESFAMQVVALAAASVISTLIIREIDKALAERQGAA